jgi:hypothetical protein
MHWPVVGFRSSIKKWHRIGIMKYLAIFLFFTCTLFFPGQTQIPVGQWRDHFPYFNATRVTFLDDETFCSTPYALFSYNRTERTLEKFSKVHGLTGTNIRFSKYADRVGILLVAYDNGSIDLISETGIYKLSDIERSMLPGKRILSDALFVENLAYLACDFGIVVLDLLKREFKDTYFIGNNGEPVMVFDLALKGTGLFAATEQGLLTGDINDPLLVDFNHWTRLSTIPGSQKFTAIESFQDWIIINQSNTINQIDSVWAWKDAQIVFLADLNGPIHSISAAQNQVVLAGNRKLKLLDQEFDETALIDTYGWGPIDPRHALVDATGGLWIADYSHGLIRSPDYAFFEALTPNGPLTAGVFSMHHSHGQLLTTGGGVTEIWGNLFKNGEFSMLKNNIWKTQIRYDYPDIVNIISHPSDPGLHYAATWNSGVLQINEMDIQAVFSKNNSSLQGHGSDTSAVKTFGLLFDRDQNLFITNSGVNDPVSVKTNSNEWKSYHFSGLISGDIIGPMIETGWEDKWAVIPRESQLFIFNTNRTVLDASDDRFRKISVTDENGRAFNAISSIIEDLNGNIWIGTNEGPLVFYNPEEALYGGNIQAQRIKIPRNDGTGLADYLLSTEEITCMMIDGANRKWIGTKESGVYLISEDGLEEIHHFHTENSPLPSNWITSMALNPDSGEIFFGTGWGVVSYRGQATQGSSGMENVYVFPNPVRHDYSGPITITGLVRQANVKVTSISGALVFETESLGGQAIWDGKNLRGERVNTGVYLVFITNDDGSQTFITKILFIQ